MRDYYVKQTPQTQGEILFYDVGQFFVYCDGVTAGTAVGKFIIDYDVELYQPTSQSEVGEFNAYISAGSQSPFSVPVLQSMEESLKVAVDGAIQAVRPGTYDINYFQNGSNETPSINVQNSVISQIVAAAGTTSWGSKH